MIIAASVLGAVAAAAALPVQAVAPARDLAGTWEGPLTVGSQSIRVVFRIRPDGTAVMDSPDQGARDIPVETPTMEGGVVRLTVPSLRGQFEGRRSDDGTVLTGVLAQGGVTLPLVLTRTATTVAELARPQNPVPPFPYRAEEVAFDNAEAPGVRLAGTLTLPDGEGPFPAAILISGTGPQDRDEMVFGHKPFAVWADALTRRGIAVLRYDDRGTAGSTGDFSASTIADFTKDAEAAFAFLASRPQIDPQRVGLIGHSEGGIIAPLVVQEGAQAAWVVTIAGPAVKGGDILVEQVRRMAEASGLHAEVVAANAAVQAELMAVVERHADDGAAARRDALASLQKQGMPEAQAEQTASQISADWFRWLVAHDPASSLAALDVPLLAVYGGKDVQVPADQNAPVLSRLKPDAEVVVLPNLNHLMQPATTGLPNEYEAIETTIDPEVLATVVDWTVAQSGLTPTE